MTDWSDVEELAFESIIQAGDGSVSRLEAIRMLRRARGDVDKAVQLARLRHERAIGKGTGTDES